MRRRTFVVTITGLLTALSVIALYLSSAFPNAKLSLAAVASLFAASALIEAGIGAAAFVFVGSAILSYLLLPAKDGVLLYVLFFGYYPVVKSLAERLRNRVLEWAIKLLVFNGALTVLWLFLRGLFAPNVAVLSPIIVYLIANAAFCVFDLGLTRLLFIYARRVSKFLRKNQR
ncbi:MAG TPA: hypothetical protein GXZ77_01535 [Papillibacter sp.]|jgi:hypothetical protein|nr:hypothetical protein [Papillibacter sp.]